MHVDSQWAVKGQHHPIDSFFSSESEAGYSTGLLDCSALLGLDHGLGYLDTWLLGWATWRGYSTLLGYQATRLGWLLR